MENIKRKIRIFFAQHGKLLLKKIGIILLALFMLKIADNIYAESKKPDEKDIQKIEEIKKVNSDKDTILEFLGYCENRNLENAYKMLSEKCIQEKYNTIEEFQKEYIDIMFEIDKDFEIDIENNMYKITILDGVLESGSIKNRKSKISYYMIEEDVLGKRIYIER